LIALPVSPLGGVLFVYKNIPIAIPRNTPEIKYQFCELRTLFPLRSGRSIGIISPENYYLTMLSMYFSLLSESIIKNLKGVQ